MYLMISFKLEYDIYNNDVIVRVFLFETSQNFFVSCFGKLVPGGISAADRR